MNVEQLEEQIDEQRLQIGRIKENVGILFVFILAGIIFFSILGCFNVFEKKSN